MTSSETNSATVTVLSAGVQTTVQDLEGRAGMWDVGVPPSGAWDDFAFALANRAVGNDPTAAGFEAVVTGPILAFTQRTLVCLAGAAQHARLDGRPVAPGVVTVVAAGEVLDVGTCGDPGMRGYLAVGGGVHVPSDLGSRSTFLLGGFGGFHGRALTAGDELPIGSIENLAAPVDVAPLLPPLRREWAVRVLPGPHGAPEHLTPDGVKGLFGATWTVDHRADRTGIRLIGPTPQWARTDGGEAGLHASNIHDSAYPVGGIMLAGDTPVIVGPDGPSLGGFVVPAVVIRCDRWILAQLRPGDTLRLIAISALQADALNDQRQHLLAHPAEAIETVRSATSPRYVATGGDIIEESTLGDIDADGHAPRIVIRRAGDHHILVEAGPAELDLRVRLWIHLLAKELRLLMLGGITEIVEGVRSLLVQTDTAQLSLRRLTEILLDLSRHVPDPREVTLAAREVRLPIALDHPAAHEAMRRYARSVRRDAPWCPDNVEFIRRINDLRDRADVFDVVTAATYLVIGLGDVYLGAPVAVPLDPRHRLVTTKYDPARTWTPQNAVGIGGVYLCVYGMEGPGGYQLVGRTVPVWRHVPGSAEQPWLLRHFDRLRFVSVTVDELAEHRAAIKSGRAHLDVAPATFSLSEVSDLERRYAAEIAEFRARRENAFAAERRAWATAS